MSDPVERLSAKRKVYVPKIGDVAFYVVMGCVIGGLLTVIGCVVADRGRTAQKILGQPYGWIMKTWFIWMFGPVWGAYYGLGKRAWVRCGLIFLYGAVAMFVAGFLLAELDHVGNQDPRHAWIPVLGCLIGVWLALIRLRSDRRLWSE